jgi:hypothetical protein
MEAQEIPLTSWSAPPFWSAPASPADETAGRTALGREPLTIGPAAMPFVALTSCRIVDTRVGFGGAVAGGAAASYTIKGASAVDGSGPCGVPSNAQAVSINLTVVGATSPGNLAVGPSDKPKPGTSTINFNTYPTSVANAAVVGLAAATPDLSVFFNGPAWATVNVIIDVNGYYAPSGIVNSLNGLFGNVSLSGSGSTSVSQNGNGFVVSSSATLTGVTAGAGLTGGGSSGSPTLAIAANGVGAANIAPLQVVKSVNGLTDGVTLAGTGNVVVTPNGNTLTFSSSMDFVRVTDSQTFANGISAYNEEQHIVSCPSGYHLLGAGGSTNAINAYWINTTQFFVNNSGQDSIYFGVYSNCLTNVFPNCPGSPQGASSLTVAYWVTCAR